MYGAVSIFQPYNNVLSVTDGLKFMTNDRVDVVITKNQQVLTSYLRQIVKCRCSPLNNGIHYILSRNDLTFSLER